MLKFDSKRCVSPVLGENVVHIAYEQMSDQANGPSVYKHNQNESACAEWITAIDQKVERVEHGLQRPVRIVNIECVEKKAAEKNYKRPGEISVYKICKH